MSEQANQLEAPVQIDAAAAFAMPLDELRRVAGIDAPAQAAPVQQALEQPAVQPEPLSQPQPAPAVLAVDQIAQELSQEDREKVSKLLGEFLTPEVKQHIANEGMAQVLGVPVEAVPQMVQGITKTVADYEANLLLMDFGQRCPGYVDTPENSTALHESLCTVLGGDPAENGYKPSVDDLEAAYALAVYRGKITPHDPQAAPVRQSRPPVMPNMTSATLGTGGQNPWAMDINQLAALAGINNGN